MNDGRCRNIWVSFWTEPLLHDYEIEVATSCLAIRNEVRPSIPSWPDSGNSDILMTGSSMYSLHEVEVPRIIKVLDAYGNEIPIDDHICVQASNFF